MEWNWTVLIYGAPRFSRQSGPPPSGGFLCRQRDADRCADQALLINGPLTLGVKRVPGFESASHALAWRGASKRVHASVRALPEQDGVPGGTPDRRDKRRAARLIAET